MCQKKCCYFELPFQIVRSAGNYGSLCDRNQGLISRSVACWSSVGWWAIVQVSCSVSHVGWWPPGFTAVANYPQLHWFGWSNIRVLALHAFGDVSPRGYGPCVYLVAENEDGSVVPSLVIAKSELAPLKTVTLSRLELLASFLSAGLLTFVHDALRLEKSPRYYYWSDSMVAPSKADPSRWKALVASRVLEIQTLTSPDRWLHCSRVENPAYLLTRGVIAEELIFSKVWLQVPRFLVETRSDEVDLFEPSAVLYSVMAKEAASPVLISATPGENVFQVERWGKLTKAIRVVAWFLRLIFNSRNKQEDRRLGDVSYDEMQHARQFLIEQVHQQVFVAELSAFHLVAISSPLVRLTPYLEDEGLLRV